MERNTNLNAADEVKGSRGCEQCYLSPDAVVKGCPVVTEVAGMRNSRRLPGPYREMALRLLARATEQPIKEIDLMDELFDDNPENPKKSTLDIRLNAAIRILKRTFGGDIFISEADNETELIQVDGTAVQIWCQTHPVTNNSGAKNTVIKSNRQQVEKFKHVTELPALTQMVYNYIFHNMNPENESESELFSQISEMIRDAISETGNKKLVIHAVDEAKKLALSNSTIRAYGKHPEASKRFHRLARTLNQYRPQEDF